MKEHRHMYTDKGEKHEVCLKCGAVGQVSTSCSMSKQEWKKDKKHEVVDGKCVRCKLPECYFDGSMIMYSYTPYNVYIRA